MSRLTGQSCDHAKPSCELPGAVVHAAEEGCYWAEVPAIPGCATQGATIDALLANLREAIAGCLAVEVQPAAAFAKGAILEIAA